MILDSGLLSLGHPVKRVYSDTKMRRCISINVYDTLTRYQHQKSAWHFEEIILYWWAVVFSVDVKFTSQVLTDRLAATVSDAAILWLTFLKPMRLYHRTSKKNETACCFIDRPNHKTARLLELHFLFIVKTNIETIILMMHNKCVGITLQLKSMTPNTEDRTKTPPTLGW